MSSIQSSSPTVFNVSSPDSSTRPSTPTPLLTHQHGGRRVTPKMEPRLTLVLEEEDGEEENEEEESEEEESEEEESEEEESEEEENEEDAVSVQNSIYRYSLLTNSWPFITMPCTHELPPPIQRPNQRGVPMAQTNPSISFDAAAADSAQALPPSLGRDEDSTGLEIPLLSRYHIHPTEYCAPLPFPHENQEAMPMCGSGPVIPHSLPTWGPEPLSAASESGASPAPISISTSTPARALPPTPSAPSAPSAPLATHSAPQYLSSISMSRGPAMRSHGVPKNPSLIKNGI